MRDILAGVGVLLILGGAMLGARLFKGLNAETARKTIHVIMGCTALTFPYIFVYRQSVVVLGAVALSAMLFLRHNPFLRKNVGSSLLGVERKSFGEIYFILSIVIVYSLHKSTFEYLIPLLILTFADSIAALVGTSYGRYILSHGQEDAKSGEGSMMFFLTAFICTLTPLQLMTEIGRAEVLVISFLIGLLAAMIEAVSKNGSDNLLLPLLTYSFLRYNYDKPLSELWVNFGIMMFFLLISIFVYKVAKFSKLAIAYALLAGYIIAIQGGALWVFPPLTLFLTVCTMPMLKPEEKRIVMTNQVMVCNTVIGIVLLYTSVFIPQYREVLYYAFSLSFACLLTVNTYNRFVNFIRVGRSLAIAAALAKAVVFIALPTLVITQADWPVAILFASFLIFAIPAAIWLNGRYDYTVMNDKAARANLILSGLLSGGFLFGIFGFVLGGLYVIP